MYNQENIRGPSAEGDVACRWSTVECDVILILRKPYGDASKLSADFVGACYGAHSPLEHSLASRYDVSGICISSAACRSSVSVHYSPAD